jgi:DNA-binding MarR family transcriptional regulator
MTSVPEPGLDTFALLVADIYEAAGALRRDGERVASSAGQTQARWQVLSVVSSGDWTVPNAADRLGTSRQAVQRIANELVAEGLAAFVDNPRHRRSPYLRLTADGIRILDAIVHQAGRRHAVLLTHLNGVDLDQMRTDLRQITETVRAEDPKPEFE